jgi:hypothetical protein
MTVPTKEAGVAGARIIEVGKGPWQVVKTRGEITLRNATIAKATVLDPNGMPLADVPLVKSGGGVNIALPENALYLCLEAK